MPLHSIFLVHSTTDVILFSKYFSLPCDQYGFEWSLRLHTDPYFQHLRKKAESTSGDELWKESMTMTHDETEGPVHIVITHIGELFIVACGTNDIDEIILSDVVDCLRGILLRLLDDRVTETVLMQGEILGKIALVLDEIAPQGLIETTDVEFAMKLAKAKG